MLHATCRQAGFPGNGSNDTMRRDLYKPGASCLWWVPRWPVMVTRLGRTALGLLYISGVIFMPIVHKAEVCVNCCRRQSHDSGFVGNAPENVSFHLSGNRSVYHDPLTCPICQQTSAPQITSHGNPPFVHGYAVVARDEMMTAVCPNKAHAGQHGARGPPSVS